MSEKRSVAAKGPESFSAARSRSLPAREPARATDVLSLIGNRALSQLLGSRSIQTKLAVGSADDPLEREADRVADGIDRKPEDALSSAPPSVVQRKSAQEVALPEEAPEEPTVAVQRKSASRQTPGTTGVETTLRSSPRGGVPLDPTLRGDMEHQIGVDFSAVRIHTDGSASQMNRELRAHAFTHGADIYFGEGTFDPHSRHGRRLIAHELAHVVQQGGSRRNNLIQRQGGDKDKAIEKLQYSVAVPAEFTTLAQAERLFERVAFGREVNTQWDWVAGVTIESIRGKTVKFSVAKAVVEEATTPEQKKEEEQTKQSYGALPAQKKQEITAETNKRYYAESGQKPGSEIKKGEEGKARMWDQALGEVMKDKQTLEALPPEVKELMGPDSSYKPQDYQHLLKIAEKLKKFSHEDLVAYKLLTIRATSDLDKFEQSVDMFLARKEELKKALDAELQKGAPGQQPAAKEPTLQDKFDEKLKDVDAASYSKLSESDRYDLARQKTSELTDAQLQYMKDHPGETLKDFAKSATLVNTPETFKGIANDLKEVANGDANSWARWAAGTGAGAKLSGWLLAVAGVLYVASWLTGVGELATIAAAGAYLLGATLVLSGVESELRIKAASKATTPEEFKRNVELAAAARANFIVGVALIVIAALLHFAAKAFFPETVKKFNTSLKNFREKVRLKGSIYELKPKITAEMGSLKAELQKSAEVAKQKALASAADLEKLTTEEFAEKLDKGDGGFLDPSKIPPDQKVNYSELLKTPEGRAAIDSYKAKLVKALKTEVVQELDRLAQEYASKIDEFLKDVDAAKNHDDMNAASDKLASALTEEKAKKFIAGEQDKLTKQKLDEASQEAHKEALTAIKDAIVKRVRARIAGQPKFQLTYTDAELDSIIAKGKELGLSDKIIEDLMYVGSRTDKAITAGDLMQQMANWANEVGKRGFPYKFADAAEFQRFSKDLIDRVRAAGLPPDDVRIQGSSLRKPGANDVDIAVFVEEAKFDQLLIDRYADSITVNKVKISLKGKSHAELAALAKDVAADAAAAKASGTPKKYNAQAATFQNAFDTGIINSKSDIIKPLKTAAAEMIAKYPSLNIETISVLIRGGKFDLKPDLPVKGN